MAAASGWPKIPNTPHSSRRRSALRSNGSASVGIMLVSSLFGGIDQLTHVRPVGTRIRRTGADGAGDLGRSNLRTLTARIGRVLVLRPFLEPLRHVVIHVLRQQSLQPLAGL